MTSGTKVVANRRGRPGTIDLGDLGQRQRMVAECRGLMDEGFDGIHVNVEPIANGDDEFLALLRALRTAVGSGMLSVSTAKPGPFALAIAPNFFWSPSYYALVGNAVDQVVVMAYDTALFTPSLYRRYASYAAASVTSTLKFGAYIPFVLPVLIWLAERGIKKDEELVKSADRLR